MLDERVGMVAMASPYLSEKYMGQQFEIVLELWQILVLTGGPIIGGLWTWVRRNAKDDISRDELTFEQLQFLISQKDTRLAKMSGEIRSLKTQLAAYRQRLNNCGSRLLDVSGDPTYLHNYVEPSERDTRTDEQWQAQKAERPQPRPERRTEISEDADGAG